jgi:hypothetical protein
MPPDVVSITCTVAPAARDRGHAAGLLRDPRRIERLHALGPEHDREERPRRQREGTAGAEEIERARPVGRSPRDHRGRRERAAEHDQRVELVLPPFALGDEVDEPVQHAQHGQALARGLPRRRRDERERDEDQEEPGQRAAEGVPPDRLPRPDPAHATVERHDVAGEDVEERPEAAAPGQPGEDGARREQAAGDHETGRPPRRHRPGAVARRDHRAEQPEERRVGLDRHAHAERETAPEERPGRALLGAARDPPGAEQEEQAEQEVALARVPGAAAQMIEREEERAGHRAPAVADATAIREEHAARRGEPPQVEEPPGQVARAADPQHGQVEQVDAGKVHVERVAVGHRSLVDQPGDVVHQRRVVDEGPAARAPHQVREQDPASGRNKPQRPARRPG